MKTSSWGNPLGRNGGNHHVNNSKLKLCVQELSGGKSDENTNTKKLRVLKTLSCALRKKLKFCTVAINLQNDVFLLDPRSNLREEIKKQKGRTQQSGLKI